MSKTLFVGTANGLELLVDDLALERLRQERENRLAWLRERAGKNTKVRIRVRPLEEEIQAVNDSVFGTRGLARKYGVTQPAIWSILRGKTWRHLLSHTTQVNTL